MCNKELMIHHQKSTVTLDLCHQTYSGDILMDEVADVQQYSFLVDIKLLKGFY